MTALRASAILAALALVSCGDKDDGVRGSGGQSSGGGAQGDGESGSDDGNDGDDGGKWDVGGSADGGGNGGDDETDACKKVDLLFVIDNSGSMADEQQNLVASFPGFIAEMQTQLATTEGYNIGVTTSDAYFYNDPACIQEGALVRQTGGVDSSNQVCAPYASGAGHMSEADDLTAKFSCAAQVGTGGDGNERPMQTLQVALTPALNAPGACNDGFIREDALLVLVIITDEEDDQEVDATCTPPQPGSPGDPQFWYDSIVNVKGGIEENIVVLALIGPTGNNACPPIDKCAGGIDGAEPGVRLEQFALMFTYGFVGQVCAPSYDSFFAEAVGLIDSACDEFTPPG